MKTCNCGGNNSLKIAIGGARCECGGRLTEGQTLMRIILRLDECDEQNTKLIGALVAAGMDTCDICGEWFKAKEITRAGDRATCNRCFDPWHFCREDDDDKTVEKVVGELLRKIRCTPLFAKLPRDRAGQLEEPFLAEHRKTTR